MAATKEARVMDLVDELLNKVVQAKTANDAAMGKTTHPSEGLDNGTHPPATGARSAENTSNIKRDVSGQAVDDKSELSPTTGTMGASDGTNIGVKQTATGEDASVEDDYNKGGGHPDAGPEGETSHPASTENHAVVPKFGSAGLKGIAESIQNFSKLGNDLLAAVTVEVQANKTAGAAPAATPPKTAGDTPVSPDAAAAAGYDLAGMLGMDKQALDSVVHNSLVEVIANASKEAEKVAKVINSYKTASAAGSSAPASPDESNSSDGAEPGPPYDGGGAPPGAGGPPGDGAGGPPGGGDGGEGGSVPIEQVIQLLQALGISPEMLQQAAAGGGGAGAGGPPPGMDPGAGAGGPPPGMGGPPPVDPTAMAGVGGPPGDGAGGPPPGPPKMGSAKSAETQKSAVNQMKAFIQEICSRSAGIK